MHRKAVYLRGTITMGVGAIMGGGAWESEGLQTRSRGAGQWVENY